PELVTHPSADVLGGEDVYMDTLAMEGVIRLLIQGTEAIGEALQLALMQYQDRALEEQTAISLSVRLHG
ncbi:MAG: hypothetical protein IJP92_18095, partial [Lachnospiraceae bacterium]|nr:hypothetical protein [Lachnospiraceae bacterium]